ncbi:NAD(P)-dependent dehydrogenase, short-chain alcohol dehydrogenase family [Spirosomataceae bacterium TFI 002]|nr:NAD(P)-dependent dehydrogenase, short-chain alcohol dehydrogenase family [Spirosomataceae bacterium TFI 002]
MNLSEKIGLVSGGSSGLGAAVVEMLLSKGCKVAILDIQAPRKSSDSVLYIETDIRNEVAVVKAIEQVIEKYGNIHFNINCAGIATAKKVLGRKGIHDLESFANTIAINLSGTFNVLKACADKMSQNDLDENGVIINTASAAAYEGQIGQAAYAASKGGIVAMTLPIAREFSTHKIRVNAIAPGLFKTPLFDGLPPEAIASLEKQVPFPSRLGEPKEFAQLVLSIIENKMINGTVLRIDGALRMNSN